jgi:PhnB protein
MHTSRDVAPPDWRSVTPRIAVPDPEGLVDFLIYVLEASGKYETSRPSEVTIGDSRIMVGGSDARGTHLAFLYVYLSDPDTAYRRAIERGAVSLEEPRETPYGDRRCMIRDPWGNTWQIAVYKGRRDGAGE